MAKKEYNKEFKLRSINSFLLEHLSISKFASMHGIPKQTLARWIKSYSTSGETGLVNKKSGVKETPISEEIESQVLQLWSESPKSKYRMRKELKFKNVPLSEWKIDKIYKKNNLVYTQK